GRAIVRCEGDIDRSTCDELRSALESVVETKPQSLRLDRIRPVRKQPTADTWRLTRGAPCAVAGIGVGWSHHRCREAAPRARQERTMASTEPRTRSALAQRVYESFQAGDMDTVRSLLASDIAWHSPGQGAEHFHGVDA